MKTKENIKTSPLSLSDRNFVKKCLESGLKPEDIVEMLDASRSKTDEAYYEEIKSRFTEKSSNETK